MIQIVFTIALWLLCTVTNAEAAEDAAQTDEIPTQAASRFDIWEYRVLGNSVLGMEDVQRSVYSFLGPDRSIDDIEKARLALETTYKDAGFPTVIVTIPEQDVVEGVVRLQVTQGEIERVKITGNQYYSRSRIREKIASLQPGEVLSLPDFRKELSTVNRATADRAVVPVFRPGKTPGKLEVELKVDDKLPLHGGIELNGRNSPDTTRTRLNSYLRYDNLWQKEHSASLQFQTTPEDRDEVEVFSFTYVMPFLHPDFRLAMYGISSESDVATLGDISVVGNGDIYGARMVMPFFGLEKYFHSFTFGFDIKDFGQTTRVADGLESDSPIDYSVFSADYAGSFNLDQSNIRFGIGTRWGVRGFGNTPGEFERRRAGARNNFMYWVANLGFDHSFLNGFEFRSRFETQLTGDPLISNEQYSAGGQLNVRGYLTSQELADEALFGSLELWSPNISQYLPDFFNGLQFVAFYDHAKLHSRQVLAGQDANVTLSGIGVGFRLSLLDHLRMSADLARALSDSSEASDDTQDGDYRLHFSLESFF